MAEAKQIFEAAAWFCCGLPADDGYSRETAEADCRAAIGRASTKHRVLFGPLRWSELNAGDARVSAAPTDAPDGIKALHVEATVTGTFVWDGGPLRAPFEGNAARITAGVHGDFTRYRYRSDDKPLWCAAIVALGGETWRDRRRQHRALRERLDWYAAWCGLWNSSPGTAAVREQLMPGIKASDRLSAALSDLDSTGAALLFRHAGRPVEDLLIEVAEIRAAAARALDSIPTKGGRAPDLPLHGLLRSLAKLWKAEHKVPPPRPQWFEGEDPESGEDVKSYQDNPFLALCEAVARLAGAEFKSKTALAGQINRAVFKKT